MIMISNIWKPTNQLKNYYLLNNHQLKLVSNEIKKSNNSFIGFLLKNLSFRMVFYDL